MNQWQWLIDYCIARNLRFCPSADGMEPWISMDAVAAIVGQETAWVSRKFKGLRRHPSFPFVKFSDLEQRPGIAGEAT